IQQVPLIVVPPEAERDRLGPPRSLAHPVRILEIRPTLASLAGLDSVDWCEGNDLVPWLAGDATSPPECPGIFKRHGLRHNGLKLIPPERLYDLRADPGETTDVGPARKDDVKRMLALFRRLVKDGEEMKERVYAGVAPRSVEDDPEGRALLQELGYLDGGKKSKDDPPDDDADDADEDGSSPAPSGN